MQCAGPNGPTTLVSATTSTSRSAAHGMNVCASIPVTNTPQGDQNSLHSAANPRLNLPSLPTTLSTTISGEQQLYAFDSASSRKPRSSSSASVTSGSGPSFYIMNPNPPFTESSTQYVGSSSGLSFFNRARERLDNMSGDGTSVLYVAADGTSLSTKEAFTTAFILPSIEHSRDQLRVFFDFAMPQYRFLHEGTTFEWLNEFYSYYDTMELTTSQRERSAILFLVFAIAKFYPRINKSSQRNSSIQCYLNAERLLDGAEFTVPTLECAQARLCQVFYLLSCSRINHAKAVFGNVVHLIHFLKMHRRRQLTPITNRIEEECRRRVFWSAYCIDKYLSTILGRPSLIHDDYVDQALPSLVNDENIAANHISYQPQDVFCPTHATVWHISLVRIVSKVLSNMYCIQRMDDKNAVALCRLYNTQMKLWKSSLPPFLNFDNIDASKLEPLHRRQVRILAITYSHAIILINRPLLLSSFSQLYSAPRVENKVAASERQEFVHNCLKAAMTMVDIINDLNTHTHPMSHYWFTQYVTFCAVVVLFVYVIQTKAQPSEVWSSYYEAAERCQRQIIEGTQDNSLAHRYKIILEELNREAFRQAFSDASTDVEQKHSIHMLLDTTEGNPPPAPSQQLRRVSTVTGWDDFDNLVLGGLEDADFRTF